MIGDLLSLQGLWPTFPRPVVAPQQPGGGGVITLEEPRLPVPLPLGPVEPIRLRAHAPAPTLVRLRLDVRPAFSQSMVARPLPHFRS